MNWIIVGVICVILSVVFGIISNHVYETWPLVICVLSVCMVVVLAIAIPASLVSNTQDIAVFRQQQEYISTHIPENEIEDAALTAKKIELNGWLYSAQYRVENWGNWSLYSKDVLELEPIE